MRELGYRSAGTLEFLYQDGEFFFIEMNTRLQVEHPISEMISGIDIVREQLRIADGAPLGYRQAEIRLSGHAIECRINAENPESFRPSPGRVTDYHAPGGLGVRVDSALYQGYEVPPYYDSLISKLIIHGKTRNECLMRLRRALEEYVIGGIETTIPLHQRLVDAADFINGDYDIHWLERFVGRPAMSRAGALRLTPEILLAAYAAGVFPMAESADDPELFWVDPHRRGIIPLDAFHLPRRLRRVVRQGKFEIRCDSAFEEVVRGCAEATEKRPNTWINDEIVRLYAALFERGAAHSVECRRGGALVGGLYGVSIGAAFFGESMFSRETDASKVALVHLVARLRLGGYRLLDTQFLTPHLAAIRRDRDHAAHAIAACSPRRSPIARPFRSSLPEDSGGDPLAALAVEQDHVVDRMLQRRQRRALREHPAAEPPDVVLAGTDLVDLQESRISPAGPRAGSSCSRAR